MVGPGAVPGDQSPLKRQPAKSAVPSAIQAAEQEQEIGGHKQGQLHFYTDSIDRSDLEKGGVRVLRKRDHILLQKKKLHTTDVGAAARAMALAAGHKAAEPESIPAVAAAMKDTVAAALKDTVADRNLQVRETPSQDFEHTVAEEEHTAVLLDPPPLGPFQVMRGHSCMMAPETQLEAYRYPSQEKLDMLVVRWEQGQEPVIQTDRMDCHLQAVAEMPPARAWPRTGFQDPPWFYALSSPKCSDR